MLAFDAKSEKKVDETNAGDNKDNGYGDYGKHLSGSEKIGDNGSRYKVIKTQNRKHYGKRGDYTTRKPR